MTTAPTIPQSFTRPGYEYRLIEQLGSAGIYEQKHKITGFIPGYEVLIIRHSKADWTTPSGSLVPAGSPMIPTSEQWGKLAWTCRTLSEARIKLTQAAGH